LYEEMKHLLLERPHLRDPAYFAPESRRQVVYLEFVVPQ